MVSGHTQAIDSAPVKANASMDTLELKVPADELDEHLRKVRALSSMDREEPHRKSKDDKSDKDGRSITANDKELCAIKGRNRKWAKYQDQRPGAGNQGAKYTINKTHYSPTDPRCQDQFKAGQGTQAELPFSIERGYRAPCDNRYQGVPCRWQGQPAITGYSTTLAKTFMAPRPGF